MYNSALDSSSLGASPPQRNKKGIALPAKNFIYIIISIDLAATILQKSLIVIMLGSLLQVTMALSL